MTKFNFFILCSVACIAYVSAAAIDTTYGAPSKPFDTYGPPPPEHVHVEEEVRVPHKPVVPVVPHKPAVPEGGHVSPPLRSKEVRVTDDRHQYAVGFEVPDEGTEVKEEGRLITTNGGWEYVIAKTGSYKYVSPEGKPVEVEWIADENGFRILSTTV